MITYTDIKKSPQVNAYIDMADRTLNTMGYTEHAYAHVTRCAAWAGEVMAALGHPEREIELARIAAYLHDIGNVVNRHNHAQTGAVMAFVTLERMGMPPDEVSAIIGAIGNHDEATASPVSAISAALILADKSDVRRTRVRNRDIVSFDIHDRVNYSVEKSDIRLDVDHKTITLNLIIDTAICPVMDYFEIFLGRMLLCRRAADFLGLRFKLVINNAPLL